MNVFNIDIGLSDASKSPPSPGVDETGSGENERNPSIRGSSTPDGGGPANEGLFQLGESERIEEQDELIMEQVLMEPDDWQKEAIRLDTGAAVRVMAGPGGGKTFVIERRYRHLVESGVAPSAIYAVTFSKDMAREIGDRVARLVPVIKGSSAMDQICTIHALCYRILRAEGDKRRVAKGWQVKKEIEEIAERLWKAPKNRPGWKEIAAVIDGAKLQGLTEEEDTEFFLRWGEYHGDRLDRTRALLQTVLDRKNILTFTDMVYGVDVKLKSDRAFCDRWQEKVQYLICDEGQDTSLQAMRVLTILATPQNRFYIVGDVDQMMYRFAGATPEANLLDGFQDRYPDGNLVLLPTNYRSTREIVERQLALIRHNYVGYDGPYESRYLKSLTPREDAPQGNEIIFRMAVDATAEAQRVADTIREEIANGTAPGEIFVGARTRAQLGHLEGPLVRARIPFINITGGSFWSLFHIQAVVSYLRLAYDESDHLAFQNVYNIASRYMTVPWRKSSQYGEYCNHRFLGNAFLSAVRNDYRTVKSHVTAANAGGRFQIRGSFQPGAEDLVYFIREIQAEMAKSNSPAPTLRYIVENCYNQYLLKEGVVDGQDGGITDDLETLMELADEFANVGEFVEYVLDAVRQAAAVKDKEWSEYVVISTIHRLKGMERNVVFGIGLCEGEDVKSGAPRGLLPHTFSMIAPPQQGVLSMGGKSRMEDERCIAFVLVSRARQRVYLSGCKTYRGARMRSSRFVQEMGLV